MPQEIKSENISKVLNNQIVFKHQEVPWGDRSLGYEVKELSPEKKESIIPIVEEIKSLVFQIINEISNKYNLVAFFENLGVTNASLFFNKYEDSFIEDASVRLNTSINEGGSYGITTILENNGEIKRYSIYIKYQTFDEFLKNLNNIKDYYLKCFNNIKNFSIENIINGMGYSSLEEMGDYYQKYLELQKTPEYKDFIEKKGGFLLKNLNNFNLKDIISKQLSFLFEIKINTSKNPWGSPVLTGLQISNENIFLFLDKYKIDNFKDFINSYKINVDTGLPESTIGTHFYLNPEENENNYDSHHSLGSFITRSELLYGSDESRNIIHHYYNNMTKYSYDNGLYFSYYKFIEDEIIKPLYNEILEIYKKPYEAYNLNRIFELSFDFFKEKILDSTKTSGLRWDTKSILVKNILTKEYVSKIPLRKIQDNLKLKIIEESRDNKRINLDNILKEIDSYYKNNTYVNNILEINTKEIKEKFLKYFNNIISNEIKKVFNKDFLNKVANSKDFLSYNYEDKEQEIDIKQLLSDDQINLLLLSSKFDSLSGTTGPHSYRAALAQIDKYLEIKKKNFLEYKNNSHSSRNINAYYFLKNIKPESIENFFNNLKNILIKQLQQEELFLQQKTSSRGFVDELKFNNINIKDLPFKIPLLKNITEVSKLIDSYSDSGIFNIFKSFDSQIFENFEYIIRYFSIFPDEAEEFFNLNDFNQIKNSIIKMFNFINSNNNYKILNQIHELTGYSLNFTNINNKIVPLATAELELEKKKDKFPDYYNEYEYIAHNERQKEEYRFNSYEEYLEAKDDLENLREDIKTNKIGGIQFLSIFFKNKNLGTKKEKLEKLLQVSQLIHNFNNNSNYQNILIGSKFFEKSYNKSIFEILNTIGSSLGENPKLIETLSIIKEKQPRLIPEGYLSEDMIYCLEHIPHLKTSNDLDQIVEKLLKGEYSENIRRFKFLITLVNQYSSTVEWMEKAKPKVEGVFEPNFSTNSFRFRVLGDLDPYHFSVGIDTNCCQAIGGAGESAAIDSFINPTAGVVVLEVKQDSQWTLAAQSYFHYVEIPKENSTETKKVIILDNIEAGRFQEIYEGKFGKDFYPKAYAILGSYLKGKGFDIVGCGEAYTDVINGQKFETSSLANDPRHFEIINYRRSKYSDFNSRSFYDLLNPKFSFEMPKDISSIEAEMTIKSARILDLCIQKTGNKKAMSLNKLSKTLLGFGFKKEASAIYKLVAINLT